MMRFLSKNIGLVMLILAAIAFTVMSARSVAESAESAIPAKSA